MKHTYPSNYPPDHRMWEVRLSWAIMDQIKPGAIREETRFYIAGLLAGAMSELAKVLAEGGNPADHPLLKERAKQ